MKRMILSFAVILTALLFLSGCGVGVHSVASGKEDVASLVFTDNAIHDIIVTIDGKDYSTQTVKVKVYKPGMNLKNTDLNTIKIEPGQHSVIVKSGDNELFRKRIFVSTGENKVINL